MAHTDRPETDRLTAAIVGETTASLWSLPQTDRLARLAARAGAGDMRPVAEIDPDRPALLFAADAILEDRLARALGRRPGCVLVKTSRDGGRRALALCLPPGGDSESATQLLTTRSLPEEPPPGLAYATAHDIAGGYDPILRKQAAPVADSLDDADRTTLERLTFGASYKGATDFVTKHVWPWPARHVTRWCAAAGLSPNQVTTASLVLMLLALAGFWQGA